MWFVWVTLCLKEGVLKTQILVNLNILNYAGSPTYFAGGVTLCKTECVPSIQMYRGRTVHLSSLEGGNVIFAKFDK